MKVLKFGGTSVGSIESIAAVVDILKQQQPELPVVVVSAMSGVTNLLLHMAGQAAAGHEITEHLTGLQNRHFDVVKALLPVQQQNPVFTRLKLYFNELEDLLQAVYALKELTPKIRDLIVSFGERCSAFMLAKIAGQYFDEVVYVDAAELVKTDSAFGQARVNTELTDLLIKNYYALHPNKLLMVTGFIGSNDAGQVTTLGRGGSDYTAALFGAALNASEIQIWTDVNGMMTADPRMVKKAFSNAPLIQKHHLH